MKRLKSLAVFLLSLLCILAVIWVTGEMYRKRLIGSFQCLLNLSEESEMLPCKLAIKSKDNYGILL